MGKTITYFFIFHEQYRLKTIYLVYVYKRKCLFYKRFEARYFYTDAI